MLKSNFEVKKSQTHSPAYKLALFKKEKNLLDLSRIFHKHIVKIRRWLYIAMHRNVIRRAFKLCMKCYKTSEVSKWAVYKLLFFEHCTLLTCENN